MMDLLPKIDMKVIGTEQRKNSPQEKTVLKQRGASEKEWLWRSPDGRLVRPPGLRLGVLREAHGLGHVGHRQMNRNLCHWWHPFWQTWHPIMWRSVECMKNITQGQLWNQKWEHFQSKSDQDRRWCYITQIWWREWKENIFVGTGGRIHRMAGGMDGKKGGRPNCGKSLINHYSHTVFQKKKKSDQIMGVILKMQIWKE